LPRVAQLGGGLTDHDRDEGRFARPVPADQAHLLPAPTTKRGIGHNTRSPISIVREEPTITWPLYEPPARPRYTPHMPGQERIARGRFVRLEPACPRRTSTLWWRPPRKIEATTSGAPRPTAGPRRSVTSPTPWRRWRAASKSPSPRYERAEEAPTASVGSTRFYEVAQWRCRMAHPTSAARLTRRRRHRVHVAGRVGATVAVNTEAKLLIWATPSRSGTCPGGFQTDERKYTAHAGDRTDRRPMDGLLRADQPDRRHRTPLGRFSILASEWPE